MRANFSDYCGMATYIGCWAITGEPFVALLAFVTGVWLEIALVYLETRGR